MNNVNRISLFGGVEGPARAGSASDGKPPPQVQPVRVGVISTWNQECGLATYAESLIAEFPTGSYRVYAERAPARSNRADEPFVQRVWQRGHGSYGGLEAAIIRDGVSILYLNCHFSFFSYPQFQQFAQAVRARGVRIVTDLHTVFTREAGLESLISLSDLVMVHNPESRIEAMANGAAAERCVVLPHGVRRCVSCTASEREALRRSRGVQPGEAMIVAFGFVQPHKGMEGVLESVHRLQSSGVPARGFIVGTSMPADPQSGPYLAALKKAAIDNGLADRVIFIDRFAPIEEVTEYLQAADVVLMNYRSQHFESSGACCTAIGAGAAVVTSISPPFMPFGDAVFHATSGYPAPQAVEIVVRNQPLRAELIARAAAFAERYSWAAIREHLFKLLQDHLSMVPCGTSQKEVVPMNPTSTKSPRVQRVLMQNRPNAMTQRGGDTVLMERLKAQLEARGVNVTIDLEGREDPARYDIVHLFNFATPDITRRFAERAVQAGTPVVVSALNEDIEAFHAESHRVAAYLHEYVVRGQDQAWADSNKPNRHDLPSLKPFDNSWVVTHAAKVLATGPSESAVLKRIYPQATTIENLFLGHDGQRNADPGLFVKQYGIQDFVLCVGRIESRKNQLMLLKALEHDDLTVVLVGGGFTYQPDYDRAVRTFRRRGKTIVLDRLSPEMLASAYAACRVHALPSWYELPGLVSLEAAASGCNVVIGERGSSIDYFGSSAFICDPAGEQSIRNAVLAAYHAPRSPATRAVAERFTWAATGQALMSIYETVLSKRSAAWPSVNERKGDPMATPAPFISSTPGFDQAPGLEQFQEILERGELNAQNHNYALAQECFGQAITLDPNSLRAHRARGAVYLAEGRIDEADASLAKAQALSPRDPRTLSGRGMVALKRGRTEEAYNFFVAALGESPDHLVTIMQLIQCSYLLNRYDDLARILEGYCARHSTDIEMQFCLAGCYWKQDRVTESERIVRQVIAQNPEHVGANELVRLINERAASRASELRRQVVTEVVTPPLASPQSNESAEWESQLAEIEEHKRRREYSAVFSMASDLVTKIPAGPYRERAELLMAEGQVLGGDIAGASALYDRILCANPLSVRALVGKGALSAHAENWVAAKDYFEQALRIQPNYDVALAGLGLCASRTGTEEQAWSYYQQALKVNPENTRALLGLIELGYRSQRFTAIEEALRGYLDMHPGDLEFVYSLAGCCFAQAKLDEARSEVEKILLFQPNHQRATELRGMILQKQGQGQMAMPGA